MRIALVSSIKRSSSGELLAQVDLAGRSILSWQVNHALEAGCERIICLCDAPADHILEQQHLVEGLGLDFHTVRNPLQIAGLVRDEDDVLILLDGLIISDNAIEAVLGKGFEPGIQTIRSSHTLASSYPDEFERIDRDRNWAGFAVVSGACARGLEDMPGDGDAMSLLLRLALQVRVPGCTLDSDILENNQWFLASDANAVLQHQESILNAAMAANYWTGPSGFFATAIVKATGIQWRTSSAEITHAVASALMVIAAVLAAIGYAPAGLGLAVLASFIGQVTLVLSDLQTRVWKSNQPSLAIKYHVPFTLALGSLVLILALLNTSGLSEGIAVPLIAVGLATLAGRSGHDLSAAFWRDTPTHFACFCLAALFGLLTEALLVFSLGALLQLLLRDGAKSDRD